MSVFFTSGRASLQVFQVYFFSIFAIIGLIKKVEVEHGDKTDSTGSGWNAADHAEELPRRPSGCMGPHDDLRHEALRANRPLPGLGVLDGRIPPNRSDVP